jgi:aryl-alcohol dehydrogenase-like predicted oxidoreductase
MGMARRNEESSIRTVDTALDHGVTMFNVGEFYNGGESEIVLGNALRQHPRDKYFVSVKFGALPSREALYGVDMNPFNVRAHLTYSLSRLGWTMLTSTSQPAWTMLIPWRRSLRQSMNW